MEVKNNMFIFKFIDGNQTKVKYYNYYHNNNVVRFATEDNEIVICGSKFIKEVIEEK
jgi:uncharacterized protein YbcV (DUF1398 family)